MEVFPQSGCTLKMCFREALSTLWKHIFDVFPRSGSPFGEHIKDVFPKGLHIVDVFPKGDVLAKRLHME
jgi:hypothetical protein